MGPGELTCVVVAAAHEVAQLVVAVLLVVRELVQAGSIVLVGCAQEGQGFVETVAQVELASLVDSPAHAAVGAQGQQALGGGELRVIGGVGLVAGLFPLVAKLVYQLFGGFQVVAYDE